jgi:translation elongation factor EF-Tu-like GTPase
MSDEIVQVVEQDVAKPMLKAVEDIGQSVPRHLEEIGRVSSGVCKPGDGSSLLGFPVVVTAGSC